MITARPKPVWATVLLVAAAFLLVHGLFRLAPDVLETWNLQVVDSLFRWRSGSESLRPAYDDVVAHVDINDSTIERLEDFYLDRTHYAEAIGNLGQMGVAAQLYDFIFAAQKNAPGDRAMIEACREAGGVYFGLALRLRQGAVPPGGQIPPEVREYLDATAWRITVQGDPSQIPAGVAPIPTFLQLAEASDGLGFLSLAFDRDAVFRRAPLLVRWKKDAFYPSFPFRAVCDFLGVPPERIILRPGRSITLEDARRPGEAEARDIAIPIDRKGNMVVNFIGPWERMHHYSFADILDASRDRDELALWREELAGRIMVVSEVSTGSSDIGPVPTDNNYPLSGIHANVIHTILTGGFIRVPGPGPMILVELALLSLILLVSLRFGSLGVSVGTVGLTGLYVATAMGLFLYGNVVLHIVRPVLMAGGALLMIVAHRYIAEEREKEVLRRSFEAYFPPTMVKKIMADPALITSGGQKKELTILFSDIRNFTRYSADMDPNQVKNLLNDYFNEMTGVVFDHQGTVDKFMGDGLMVFFGDPDPQPDHALRCVRAAVEMQRRVRKNAGRWEKMSGMTVEIRIGINTGEVVAGNMGSARRLSYTVIGSAVNLAQRLESKAPVGGILISERTHELVKDHVETSEPRLVRLKGYDDFVTVHEVVS